MPVEYKNNVLRYGDLTDFFGYVRIPLANVAHIGFSGGEMDVYLRDTIVGGCDSSSSKRIRIKIPSACAADKGLAGGCEILKQFVRDWEAQYASNADRLMTHRSCVGRG